MKYNFKKILQCNMCGSPTSKSKLMGKRLNTSQGYKPYKKSGITVSILRCKNCELIYSNPLPIPEQIEDHYSIPPEDYWTESYFKLNEHDYAYEKKTLQNLMSIKKDSKMLDIGAGIGKFMTSMENLGFEVYGFEPSKPFFDRAISKMKINPDRLKLASIENVEYPANEFDFVSLGAVLEHIYDPNESLKKAIKWLKPGGLIYIEVPSSNWLTAKIYNTYYKIIGTDYVTNLSPMHAPFHLYEFSHKTFAAVANELQFQIVKWEYIPCETFLPKFFNFIIHPFMKKTNTGLQLCIWLKKN